MFVPKNGVQRNKFFPCLLSKKQISIRAIINIFGNMTKFGRRLKLEFPTKNSIYSYFYFLDKSRTLAGVSSETLHRQGKKLKLGSHLRMVRWGHDK